MILEIQANHCPGAVMFLIEGDGKAVLYTGDIRGIYKRVDSGKKSLQVEVADFFTKRNPGGLITSPATQS